MSSKRPRSSETEMVSERGLPPRFTQYTAAIHSWLPKEVKLGYTTAAERYRAMLSFFEKESDGGRRVRDILDDVAEMEAIACQEEIADEATVEKMKTLTVDSQRWKVIVKRLAALLPTDNQAAPEAQLMKMELWPDKEELLGFCERFRQSAETFINDQKVSPQRAFQILFKKMPSDVKNLLANGAARNPGTAKTMKTIEDVVREKSDWLLMADPGDYPPSMVAQYLPTMKSASLQMMDAHEEMSEKGSPGCNAVIGLIKADGSVNLDKIKTYNHVMIAWKALTDYPRFYRESAKHMAQKKPPGKPRNPAPDLNHMGDYSEMEIDDPETAKEDSPAQLYIMSQPPQVCAQINPLRKPSIHVPIVINGKKLSALVDTGATTSFIQLKALRMVGLEHLMRPCDLKVALGNGEMAALQGQLALDVQIYHDDYTVEAYVLTGKGPAVILGFAFLEEADLLVSCKEKKLMKADGSSIQCHVAQMQPADLQMKQMKQQLSQLENTILTLQKNDRTALTRPAGQC